MLGISAITPALLFGAVLIVSPILIHLLSKRKFKVLDWAAMDFLIEADRRNRRRIRLENLLLLLLRCLAVILIAILVSRPFLEPTGLGGLTGQMAPVERIVLLDDSPSMAARAGSRTCFDEAIDGLIKFVNDLAEKRSGDSFTLLLTSRAEQPVVAGQYLSGDRVEAVVDRIEGLEVSDMATRLDDSLLATERALTAPGGHINRMLYVISDMRRRDWSLNDAGDTPTKQINGQAGLPSERSVETIVRNLAGKAHSVVIIDVGSQQIQNLAVTDVSPLEDTLAVGVDQRFEVTLKNYGDQDAHDVAVRFTAGESLSLVDRVDELRAGQAVSVPFVFTFREPGAIQVQAEIEPDVLPADNRRYCAVRVSLGLPILLVDGESSSPNADSGALYLARALTPPGDVISGNVVDVVTENQFEGMSLERYHVIVLCNLYRITEDRRDVLKTWVSDGGGLVFFLGDQIDDQSYNQWLNEGNGGLLPMRLTSVSGDESRRQWVELVTQMSQHPVLRIFDGGQNPFRHAVKIFRWWSGVVPIEADRTAVLATYSDPDASPAIVESSLGLGRALVITTSMQSDWTNWTSDPSFVVTMLEMVRYMAPRKTEDNAWIVGMPLHYALDPSRYALDATLVPPLGQPRPVRATPAPGNPAPGPGTPAPANDSVPTRGSPAPGNDPASAKPQARGDGLVIEDEGTNVRGFYRLQLTTHEGVTEDVVFASNINATEGDLHRADESALIRRLEGANVQIMRGGISLTQDTDVARTELWRTILISILVVLCVEQLLGWFFGRSR